MSFPMATNYLYRSYLALILTYTIQALTDQWVCLGQAHSIIWGHKAGSRWLRNDLDWDTTTRDL